MITRTVLDDKLIKCAAKKVRGRHPQNITKIIFTEAELTKAIDISKAVENGVLKKTREGYMLTVTDYLRKSIMEELRPEYMQAILEALNKDDLLKVNMLKEFLPKQDSRYFAYLLSEIIELPKNDIYAAECAVGFERSIKPTGYDDNLKSTLYGSRKKALSGDFAGAIEDFESIVPSLDTIAAIAAENNLLNRALLVQNGKVSKQKLIDIIIELLSTEIPANDIAERHATLISCPNDDERKRVLANLEKNDTIQAEPVRVEGQDCIAVRLVEPNSTMVTASRGEALSDAKAAFSQGDFDLAIKLYLALLKNMKTGDNYIGDVYLNLGLSYYTKFASGKCADDILEDIIHKGIMYLSLAKSHEVGSNLDLYIQKLSLVNEMLAIRKKNRAKIVKSCLPSNP